MKVDNPDDPSQQKLVNSLLEVYDQVTSIALTLELTDEQTLEYEKREDEIGDDVDKIEKFYEDCGVDIEKVKAEAFTKFAEGYLRDVKNVKFNTPNASSDSSEPK